MKNFKISFSERANICFGKNDLRCVYGIELDEEIVYRTGYATAQFLKCKKIIVGRDIRSSSEKLKQMFIKGVRESGCEVVDIGIVDSPQVYFASGKYKLPAAIITASHNPAKYNGIKIVNRGAVPLGEKTGLNQIKTLTIKNNFKKRKLGKLTKKSLTTEYKKHIFNFFNSNNIKNLRVIVDAGNGVAGIIVPQIYKNLKINLIKKHFEIHGNFPHHESNPAKQKNVKDLKIEVKKRKADIGIAFDSDMDRVAFIDEKGNRIDSSLLASLMIRHFLCKNQCGIVYNHVMSDIVKETIQKYHGKDFKEKVGHAFIKARMKKTNSLFGAENSFHYYFLKNFHADSGIITSLIILEITSIAKKQGKKFSELFKEFKKYYKINEVSIKIKDQKSLIEKIEKKYKSKNPDKIEKIQGVTFRFKDYWFNVRPSNTEPLIRLNLEANNSKIAQTKKKELVNFIQKQK